jgi:hypothetical protein
MPLDFTTLPTEDAATAHAAIEASWKNHEERGRCEREEQRAREAEEHACQEAAECRAAEVAEAWKEEAEWKT